MFRKVGLFCAALAMFSIAGGHWAVLQSVAWVQMLGDYSQQPGSVAMAVVETFDGQHPCKLCREIQVAKSRERKSSDSTAPTVKDDAQLKALLAESDLPQPERPVSGISFPRTAAPIVVSRTDPPPTPPPRRGSFAA